MTMTLVYFFNEMVETFHENQTFQETAPIPSKTTSPTIQQPSFLIITEQFANYFMTVAQKKYARNMTHVGWDEDGVIYEVDDGGHTKYVCLQSKQD